MTAVLPSVSTDHPPPTVALPDLHSGTQFLTVTTRPAPPNAVVIAVRGEVDLVSSPLLRDFLLGHMRHVTPQLVIDLTEVDFLGAAGLTVLVDVRETAVALGIRMFVVAHTRAVLLPLAITGLDGVFDIYPDLAHALLRLCSGPDG
jgi:anti-sigma B factor antagonist